MIKLTLDAQNNQIILEDAEAKEHVDLGMVSLDNCDLWAEFPDAYHTKVTKMVLTGVDFEGLFLRLVDSQGQEWSTEITGMVAHRG